MSHLITRLLLGPLVRLLFRPIVTGRENIPAQGPVIVASNHLSFIDSVLIWLMAPRPVVFLTKAEYFQGRGVTGRLTRWAFTTLGAVPVQRGTHRAAQSALEAARQVLDEGGAFGIYPEGTRSLDGRLYRGRTGVAWLALATRAPVVPVALTGTDRIQPVGARFPRPHRVTVRFGTPLHFAEPSGASAPSARARRAVTDEIMQAIEQLSGQERAPGYNSTPLAA
jgi:1-acyl-sn-glycerol-3-phosphate acyltransferase